LSVALTIAGSDSSGSAGIAADLRVFGALGVPGALAVTAVTAQNTLGVQAVEEVTPELVRAQIASVASDLAVAAAKTGMLGSAAIVEAVAYAVQEFGLDRLVVDPVMVASSGGRLLDEDAVAVLKERLLPLATVVTPNLNEAAALVGWPVGDRASMEKAAHALADLGPQAVLVTGGHLGGDGSPDYLVLAGAPGEWLEARRVPGGHSVRGTGCVLSAAICAQLALGEDVEQAVLGGKDFVSRLLSATETTSGASGSSRP
jgi:hydroxymethylpyrimidine/phosphomethylpyrimidine kinase